jgi:hypothetical protein
VYPSVKYALGHGKACTRLVVGGESIAVDRELSFGHGPLPTPMIADGQMPTVV